MRGICCLRPGVPGMSEQHHGALDRRAATWSTRASTASPTAPARASPAYFIGSADLMPRNLDRRVEILVLGRRSPPSGPGSTRCWRPGWPTTRPAGSSEPTARWSRRRPDRAVRRASEWLLRARRSRRSGARSDVADREPATAAAPEVLAAGGVVWRARIGRRRRDRGDPPAPPPGLVAAQGQARTGRRVAGGVRPARGGRGDRLRVRAGRGAAGHRATRTTRAGPRRCGSGR